jgi:enoyl-CoA hydratase/carnithine racemase
MYQTIVTEIKNKTGVITLSREERRNAISPAMIVELFDALKEYDHDSNILGIVTFQSDQGFKQAVAGTD